MQQVQEWMVANTGTSALGAASATNAGAGQGAGSVDMAARNASTQLLVAVEGFSHALRLATSRNNTTTTTSSSSSSASIRNSIGQVAALQLLQQWQQLLSVLLPVLGALDAALRLSDVPSSEQQQLLAACEFYVCVRPSKDSSRASFKVAERSGMLWCLSLTQPLAATAAAEPSSSSGGTLQLNVSTMLERAAAYWRWWIADQGTQLASLLEQQWADAAYAPPQSNHNNEAMSTGSSSSSAVVTGLRMLLQSWDIPQVLLHQVLRRSAATQNSSSNSSIEASHSISSSAATAVLCEKLLAVQQTALQHVAAALLMPSYASSELLHNLDAAAVLYSLLQQPRMAELVNQLAAAVLQGGAGTGSLAAASKHHGRADAFFRSPPPNPQPEGPTSDRIGQLCLLAPLLDPFWVPRAALQGSLVMRRPAGPQTPVPWLRRLQAAEWLGKGRSSDVYNPPAGWTQWYPVCQYAWRCCIGLRDYLKCLGVLPTGLSGGFMPHTLCALLELAVAQ
jgi:hypothetical protein